MHNGPCVQITVVACFYNTEIGLAKRCIDSLLGQTFDGYEIVLVDDGSSGDIVAFLDSFAEEDIVRVFHKNNGGISDARNYGVKMSQGHYVTFVDGDDIVAPHHLSVLYNAVQDSPSDTIVFGKSFDVSLKTVNAGISWPEIDYGWKEYSRTEVVERILYKYRPTVMWGNIAERSFYANNPFDTTQRYDEALIAPIVASATSYRETACQTYGYIIHANSMIRSRATNEQVVEYIDAIEEGQRRLVSLSPDLEKPSRYWSALYAVRAHGMARKAGFLDGETMQRIDEMSKKARQDVREIMHDKNVGLAARLRIVLFALAPQLHDLLLTIYERMIKEAE